MGLWVFNTVYWYLFMLFYVVNNLIPANFDAVLTHSNVIINSMRFVIQE